MTELSNETVKILTWNTWLLPKWNMARIPKKRSKFMPEIFKSFNIIALQEVFVDKIRTDLIDAMNSDYNALFVHLNSLIPGMDFGQLELTYRYGAEERIIKSAEPPRRCLQDSGFLLLFKKEYRLLDSDFIVFEDSASSDRHASKGALYAKLEIPTNHGKTILNIFVTHLQASYNFRFKRRDDYYKIREKQLKVLKKFVSDKSDDNTMIITGDFNIDGCEPDKHEYVQLKQHFPECNDLWRINNPNEPGFTNELKKIHGFLFNLFFRTSPKRFDYMLVKCDEKLGISENTHVHQYRKLFRKHWYSIRKKLTYLSDHWAVSTELILPSQEERKDL